MVYDNAHGVPHRGGRFVRPQAEFDHWHRDETDEGRPYKFVSAEKLVADFFDEIARILKERKISRDQRGANASRRPDAMSYPRRQPLPPLRPPNENADLTLDRE
jgi:hypothetical protein